jgi:hypothetical protein
MIMRLEPVHELVLDARSASSNVAQIVTNPLWVAKTRLQTQHMQLHWRREQGALYTGSFNTLARMAREEGLLGLYRCDNVGLAKHMAFKSSDYKFSRLLCS